MRKNIIVFLLSVFSVLGIFAQQTVKGKVVNSETEKAMANVTISVVGTNITQKTATNGAFELRNIPVGNQIVKIQQNGFETQQFPVKISNKTIDLGEITLFEDFNEEQIDSTISLSDSELDDDEGSADNTSGLLQSSKDVFTRAAAFNFPWFRARGYDSDNATVLVNGIRMNKLNNGRPQWSDWGGLNDALRNQEFSNGLVAFDKTFGGILGSTHFNTRASKQRAGTRLSLASSNRSYTGRAMVTHATGLNDKGWAFTMSGSRRYGKEGFREGSSYNAWSGLIAIEKKLNEKHSLNLTAFYTPNRRGKASPMTQEVYDIKGEHYNSYWGKQGNEIRNSRMKEIKEPIFILSHYFDISDRTTLNTNVAYQSGSIGNSRLGYFRALNPDPTYYQKLPSYALAHNNGPNYAEYYTNLTNFKNDGQVDWEGLYNANNVNGESVYYLYEDRNDDTTISANTNLSTELSENITLNGKLNYAQLESKNFANMLDLLGGTHFTDLNQYETDGSPEIQNDLNNPNRQIKEGDTFNYNYIINSTIIDAFAQLQFAYDKVDFFVAGKYARTSHQREGLYKNGLYRGISFGKGEEQIFNDASFKGGLTYKLTGRHLINVNAGYLSDAPNHRNTFGNSRLTNTIVPNVKSQKITSIDASYIYRAPGVKARLTGYMTDFKDATETAFYFAEGALTSDFFGEIVTGIEKRHLGVEFGIETQVTSTIKLTGVAAIGKYKYANNPDLYLTADSRVDGVNLDFENGLEYVGTSYLKNVNVSGTPRQAYSLGFEYRDPNYWWFGVNANYMKQNYLDISPYLRTDRFWQNGDGTIAVNPETENLVTQEEVDAILIQEEFEAAFLVNAVGGKSWKVGSKYIGFFATINNILGNVYKTGGYQQSRKASFSGLQEQNNLETPTFGNKYWFGNKTTYYLNLYIRF